MTREIADQLIGAVEAAQERTEFTSAYSACKAACVPFAEYKEARFLVYGINTTV
ncbi:hypothetical protein [Pseudomonas aeruginosa]|uniref:hypothetical protein n=1 Tax=Pseudomonas aeruginosa TaxID=287 RepID=UPI00223787D2|nr:hypothetical protein [Pseudomonas aeruginosa]MCW4647249.1 hypothetical protein [Pseudomonas aeruginosa]